MSWRLGWCQPLLDVGPPAQHPPTWPGALPSHSSCFTDSAMPPACTPLHNPFQGCARLASSSQAGYRGLRCRDACHTAELVSQGQAVSELSFPGKSKDYASLGNPRLQLQSRGPFHAEPQVSRHSQESKVDSLDKRYFAFPYSVSKIHCGVGC